MDTTYIEQTTGFSEQTVKGVIDGFIKFIQLELRAGNEVKVSDFGVFYPKELGERQARNPRTGEAIIAKPKTKPRFKFYDSFEKMIQDEVEGRGARSEGRASNTALNTASPPASITPPPPPQDLITPPSPVPPPPPAEMVSRTWHISLSGEKVEPVAENQLITKGVTSATPIWSEGTGWKRAGEIPELKYLFAA